MEQIHKQTGRRLLGALFIFHISYLKRGDQRMGQYIHFTEEQKLRAGAVDLEEFLRQRGEKLIVSGREKRLTSDHSITVRGNEWYDHAAEKGGGPVSFVQTFYDLSYPRLWRSYSAVRADRSITPRRRKRWSHPSPLNCRRQTRICTVFMDT